VAQVDTNRCRERKGKNNKEKCKGKPKSMEALVPARSVPYKLDFQDQGGTTQGRSSQL